MERVRLLLLLLLLVLLLTLLMMLLLSLLVLTSLLLPAGPGADFTRGYKMTLSRGFGIESSAVEDAMLGGARSDNDDDDDDDGVC